MTNKPPIVGTVVMSDRGPLPKQPGRSAVMMLAVVSMPTEEAELFASKEWDLRVITGSGLAGMGELLHFAVQRDPFPFTNEEGEPMPHLRMARVDQLVTSGVWRI